ncbi:hypothetical protein CLHOM_05440 [Clostridium homopropionicum DSM 5847]|uniref:Prepilin-type N-terminal cleavage/methylation domain-containing protein n=1 Tax=Clostridium homopropionicum DSM 5847 TaxID=1121318 RepID=A0A0L6ZDA0_9CLOT|nr:prepilin-type N-terminal cleavage/methylation domain-containing protein [Clostridium homopropionicum]KOA20956.1 hypothetical protein CLHOM_05440 [Clostridium homopropionicum DSM 5847]SFG01202.1 prepilin-type N-terminal cleavage/methylation domain-containing protein [Clostridium homopropionicum]
MKKGFTLMELIISLAIVFMVILIEIKIFSQEVYTFKEFIKSNRNEVYSREALRFIEGEINDFNNKTIKVYDDKILFEKINGDKNTLKLYKMTNGNNKIVISYYKALTSKITTNTVVDDIKDLNISYNANLVYLSIFTLNGEKYERCFGSKKIVKAL